MRASTRSPMPAAGPLSCLLSAMRMRGGGPCSSGQLAGRAMNSPWESRSTISSTVTDGTTPGRWSLRREPAISPSSAISRNSSFRATRSPPLTPKARAISRLPACTLAPCRKSRISCLEGSLPTFWDLGAFLVLATPLFSTRGSKLVCRLLDDLFLFLRLFRFARLARRLLCRPLGGSRGDQLDGVSHRHLFRVPVLGQSGVDLAVLHVRSVAAAQHLYGAFELGVLAEVLDDGGASANAVRGLLGEQAYGAIDADGEDLVGAAQARIFAVVLNVGPEAAKAGGDGLARFGMSAN